MKSDSSLPVRIRARDVRDATRWQLPDMNETERERLVALALRTPVETAPAVEVVEEEVYAEKLTLNQWEALCDEARQEGLEQGRAEGLEQGRQTGLEQGLQEGLAQGQAQIQAEQARLAQLIEALQQPLRQQQDEFETVLMSLVQQLARAVVGAELATRPELLQQTIQEALTSIPPSTQSVRLALHPADCELLAEQAERQGWELVPDASIEPGGVRLEAGSCRIDAEVATRFEQVAEQLRARLVPRGGDESAS